MKNTDLGLLQLVAVIDVDMVTVCNCLFFVLTSNLIHSLVPGIPGQLKVLKASQIGRYFGIMGSILFPVAYRLDSGMAVMYLNIYNTNNRPEHDSIKRNHDVV